MSKLDNFKLKEKLKNQRTEFLECLLADLLIIDKNAALMLQKNNVLTVSLSYKKVYFEKTLKQINDFLLFKSVRAEFNGPGLIVILKHCTIQIIKDFK